MSKIALLSEETIGKIAAGEVVETPACAIKEIVENALDAKASSIDIAITGGGLQKIAVSDNGEGMTPADARLATVRHATSKLSSADDLIKTATMGFRGEALAAIAAVSEMRLTTQSSEGLTGISLTIEWGKIVDEKIAAGEMGTAIEIYNLFDNAPVRRSFQTSPKNCENSVVRTIEALALGHPKVAMRLFCDGKQRLVYPLYQAGDLMDCLERRLVESGEKREDLIEIRAENSEGKIEGFIGTPERCEQGPARQKLYINERFVSSREIEGLVRSGFSSAISEKKAPFFCLHISLPFENVDINIHPKKKEVDFRLPQSLAALLQRRILQSLVPKQTFSLRKEGHSSFPLEFSPDKKIESRESAPTLFQKPKITYFHTIGPYTLFEVEEQGTWICHRARLARAYLFDGFGQPKIKSHPLLVPLPIPIDEDDLIESPLFTKSGFSLRLSGPRSALIEAAPSCLALSLIEPILREMFAALKERENLEHVIFLEKVVRRLKKSPAPTPSNGEVQAIIEELFASGNLKTSPLYTQALRILDEKQIDRFFG